MNAYTNLKKKRKKHEKKKTAEKYLGIQYV